VHEEFLPSQMTRGFLHRLYSLWPHQADRARGSWRRGSRARFEGRPARAILRGIPPPARTASSIAHAPCSLTSPSGRLSC
jgi:hypothetical protein